jgi:hypothetical protein
VQRTLVEFDGGLVDTFHDFARRKVDLDFKDSARGLELSVCGGEEVVVMVTNTAGTNAFCFRLQFPLRRSFQPAIHGIMWSTIVCIVGLLLVRVQI